MVYAKLKLTRLIREPTEISWRLQGIEGMSADCVESVAEIGGSLSFLSEILVIPSQLDWDKLSLAFLCVDIQGWPVWLFCSTDRFLSLPSIHLHLIANYWMRNLKTSGIQPLKLYGFEVFQLMARKTFKTNFLVWRTGICQGRWGPPNYYYFEIKSLPGKDMG